LGGCGRCYGRFRAAIETKEGNLIIGKKEKAGKLNMLVKRIKELKRGVEYMTKMTLIEALEKLALIKKRTRYTDPDSR